MRGRRRSIWSLVIGTGLALALVGGLVARWLWPSPGESCTVRGADGKSVTLDADQASHAATIAAVARARGLSQRAVTIALATAIQESKLRNLTYGDRDSLGLFQQRPSEGWGTAAQVRDPVYASGKFYDALEKVPGYPDLPVTVAAQRVQHSDYPAAYARHEDMATMLAAALTGIEGPAVTCTMSGKDASGRDRRGGAPGAAVTTEVRREFGADPTPASGSAVDGIAYPVSDTATGWSLALWMVCHAGALHITTVTFDGRQWSSAAPDRGWTAGDPSSGDAMTVDVAFAPTAR
jgi:hypothetical protein